MSAVFVAAFVALSSKWVPLWALLLVAEAAVIALYAAATALACSPARQGEAFPGASREGAPLPRALLRVVFPQETTLGSDAATGLPARTRSLDRGEGISFAVSSWERWVRGLLIGLNAGLNGVLLAQLLPAEAGLLVAALNLGAALHLGAAALSQRREFRALLGYANWLLPMSWPIVAVGALFLLVSGPWRLRAFDAATGTLFVRGGWIADLNPLHTAFNMGAFTFVDSRSPDFYVAHEAGHTLNLAAFGSVFHLVGAIDENWLHRGSQAYAERLADSHVPGMQGPRIPRLWG